MTGKPEDATWIGPWDDGRRLFDGQSWTVEHTTHNGRPYPITVAVIGAQYDDGHVQRSILLDVPGGPITAAEAHSVIDALTEAVAMADTETKLQNTSRKPTSPKTGRPESGTARSLIQTSARALRLPEKSHVPASGLALRCGYTGGNPRIIADILAVVAPNFCRCGEHPRNAEPPGKRAVVSPILTGGSMSLEELS